jgi:CSLREA domain-containing protein
MIGRRKSGKSCLSTSKKRTSHKQKHPVYEQLERRNLLTTFVVTTTDDIVAEDGLVSLREAVTAANTNATFSDVAAGSEDGDRIVFSPDIREQSIQLDEELQILDDLLIRGFEDADGNDTLLTADSNRLLNIDTNERVYIRDVNLSGGSSDAGGNVQVASDGNVISRVPR